MSESETTETIKMNPELEILNGVETWARGVFIIPASGADLSESQVNLRKQKAERLVKASIDGGYLCEAQSKDAAEWICGRLNLLAKLQKKAIEVFTGDGSDADGFMDLVLNDLVGLEDSDG